MTVKNCAHALYNYKPVQLSYKIIVESVMWKHECVTCDCQVQVAFNRSSASPGESISIETVTSPHSVVVLSVFDKSLTLLADACKSLESDNVSCSL